MSGLPNTFNFNTNDDMTLDILIDNLQRMYQDLATTINSKPSIYERDVDGQTVDTFLPQGSININLTTNKVEMLTNHVNPTSVTWVTLG